ncbi:MULTISPECIES: cupredoxin domain-containing protein [unclassified Leucobacter]|uniref:cupredoxin domain-containing protein n=1 Tax=unclassified Leucobacter TaxID=2621730 RepID=UPI00301771F7
MFRETSAITRRAVVLGALGVGSLVGLTACSASKPAAVPSDDVETDVVVHIIDNRYVPAEIDIAAGTAVRWVFEGTAEHDVVAADGSFVSELMTEGSYTHVFKKAGDFAYDCSVHPEMTGVVRVSAQ